MSSYLDFQVKRDDLREARVVDGSPPGPDSSEVLLEIGAFGLTSNNITYAALGEQLSYWDFFPADDGWGRIPVWGFAEVRSSRHRSLTEGTRVFGFLPPSSHLIVRPDRVGETAFVDAAEHRVNLPPAYNSYLLPDSDPYHDPDREDQQMLLRPVFFLSFLITDFLGERELFGARVAILSSASSKASLGIAFLLAQQGVRAVGLTSEAKREFVEGLAIYEQVVSYSEINELNIEPAVYIDISGDPGIRKAIHQHFGDALLHSCAGGGTHWEKAADRMEPLPGPKPVFFFTPDRIVKRARAWGRRGLESRIDGALGPFVDWTEEWLEVARGSGAEAIQAAYREVLDGRCPPSTAHVLIPQPV